MNGSPISSPPPLAPSITAAPIASSSPQTMSGPAPTDVGPARRRVAIRLDDRNGRMVACADFVLGKMTPAEQAFFLSELAVDPALQAEVRHWQNQLLGLGSRTAATGPETAPAHPPLPAASLHRIGLDTPARPVGPVGPAQPLLQLDPAAALAYNEHLRRVHERSPWRDRRIWGLTGALAVAASLLLAVLIA